MEEAARSPGHGRGTALRRVLTHRPGTSHAQDRGADDSRVLVRSFAGSLTSRSAVVHPSGAQEWVRVLAEAGERGITVRGSGASYSDAALNDAGTIGATRTARGLSRSALEPSVLEDGTGVLDVDAGATLGEVLACIIPRGWSLPVLPGTARATVGGALAADVHGKNHPACGSFAASVLDATVLTPGEGINRVGPRRDPDAFWATAGGLGLTGVVLDVRLRLVPVSSSWMVSTDTACDDLDRVLATMLAHQRGREHVVAWIDGHSTGIRTGRGVVSAAAHLTSLDLPARIAERPLEYRPGGVRLRAPAAVNLVRPSLVRSANAMRFTRAAQRHGDRIMDIPSTLHPLDAVADWPTLYGRAGLIQYQYSVPDGEERVLGTFLRALHAAACPPSLVVLKRLGAAGPGQLSFPSPGWTMALDLPTAAAAAAARVLDHLDDLVCAAGGRVYLVKDSRLHPDLVTPMYPRLQQWRAIRDRMDPAGVMTSDLDRRLNLSGRHPGED